MTTDTKPLAPTDAELNELADACTPNTETGSLNYRKFARAALAKWGTPAHSGEPWGACVSGRVFVGGLPDHVRKLAEAENLPIQWLYTTPQPTQPQAEPKSGAKSFQTYGEANAYSKGYYAGKKAATQAQAGAVPLTDEQIDAVAESMPGGLAGFLKGWGWRQFAREILTLRRMPDWEPQFDCMTPKQEELAIQFCQEIAGPRGERGSPPDPVRLLEMAEALYKAEREHHHGIKGGQHVM